MKRDGHATDGRSSRSIWGLSLFFFPLRTGGIHDRYPLAFLHTLIYIPAPESHPIAPTLALPNHHAMASLKNSTPGRPAPSSPKTSTTAPRQASAILGGPQLTTAKAFPIQFRLASRIVEAKSGRSRSTRYEQEEAFPVPGIFSSFFKPSDPIFVS
jgi:hypothetical protein